MLASKRFSQNAESLANHWSYNNFGANAVCGTGHLSFRFGFGVGWIIRRRACDPFFAGSYIIENTAGNSQSRKERSSLSNRNTFRFPVPREVLEFTGERFTTAVEGEIRHEHFHRYLFALQFCTGKSVLDVASGEGYGSALLGTVAAEVIGVDKSSEAVRHANLNYYDRNVSFRIGQAGKLPISDGSIDVVVSFETLEHLTEHDLFLAEIRRVLRSDGLLIMSSPDRDAYTGEKGINNPHHKRELTRTEFRQLIDRNFLQHAFLAQNSITGSVIAMDLDTPSESGFEGFRRLYDTFFERQSGLCSPMYLICVASQASLPRIAPGIFDDRQFQLGLYAELQRRHEELLRKESEIASLRKEMADAAERASTQAGDHRKELEILNGRLHESSLEISERAAVIFQLKTEMERGCSEISARDAEIAQLRMELEQGGAETNIRDAEIAQLRMELEQGFAEINIRNNQIAQLRMELERSTNDLTESNERMRALTTERRSLRDVQKRLEARAAEIAQSVAEQRDKFEAELGERASEIENLKRLGEERSVLIAARDRQVSDRDEQIASLKKSLSWKLTAPMRAATEGLIALRNLLYKTPAFAWTGKPLAKAISSVPVPFGSWLLPHNSLFDSSFYRQQYPDAAKANNLWAHYLGYGADEDRNPHPLFDTSFYRQQNADVAASRVNALVHYLEFGASEGRNPHRSFETLFYLEAYPDVRGKINPLLHYWLYGRTEGRSIAPGPQPSSERLTPANANNDSGAPQRSEHAAPVAQPGPLISIIVPTYNTPARYLRLAIDSVRTQTYPNWRLCIYDDGSTKEETLQSIKDVSALDQRIRVQFGSRNQGISRASNAALAMAQGEYVAMLDHDDELTPDALQEVAQLLMADWTIDAVYTDQRYIGPNSELQEPFYKTDWSPELFRGVMFVGHLLVVRLELARKLSGFNPQFDRVQDFEFMLRVSESTKRVRHLAKVL